MLGLELELEDFFDEEEWDFDAEADRLFVRDPDGVFNEIDPRLNEPDPVFEPDPDFELDPEPEPEPDEDAEPLLCFEDICL